LRLQRFHGGPVPTDTDHAGKIAELPCIRCGGCAQACPARLQPQQLLVELRGGRLDRAQAQGLQACTECGICDLVCPSHIALAGRFQVGKQQLADRHAQAERAESARLRHEARARRLQRESEQRAALELARQAAVAAPDAVAVALARARARREASKSVRDGNDAPP
jgi:electron transport complex protein RnfC